MSLENNFRLKEILGEGSAAVTFRAEDKQGQSFCVKQFKTSLKLKERQRIEREIEILQKLTHPQIPRVYGSYVQEVGGRELLHIVQELIDGEDLSVVLESTHFSLKEVQEILSECLDILSYLHGKAPPIIHRDIKPSNLMRRKDGKIILIDFGQAIHDIHRTYGQTMVTGTLGYQAPEQIYGESTAKSDVYSLGVVGVELFTQKKAYQMLEGQRLRWERYCSHLSLELQKWLDGVLHQEVFQRYSAQEALDKLSDIGDIFYEPSSAGSSTEGVNAFRNILDEVISGENEEKEKAREEEYRQKIEAEREKRLREDQEREWKETEMALWNEMEGSFSELLKAIQQEKLSPQKGLKVFRKVFEQRVQDCKKARKWGEMNPYIEILLNINTSHSKKEVFLYKKWVHDDILAPIQTQIDKIEREKDIVKIELQELEMSMSKERWYIFWGEKVDRNQVKELQEKLASLKKKEMEYRKEMLSTIERYFSKHLGGAIAEDTEVLELMVSEMEEDLASNGKEWTRSKMRSHQKKLLDNKQFSGTKCPICDEYIAAKYLLDHYDEEHSKIQRKLIKTSAHILREEKNWDRKKINKLQKTLLEEGQGVTSCPLCKSIISSKHLVKHYDQFCKARK